MNTHVMKKWVELSAFYQKPLPDFVLRMYASDVDDLDQDLVFQALDLYRRNQKNRTCPLPADIRAIVEQNLSNHDLAQQACALIKQAAIDKQSSWLTGYFWGKHPESGEDVFYFEGKDKTFWTWREAAQNYFGDLGLAIVDHMGGWQRVCEMFNESLETVIWSQVVKASESVLAIHRLGKTNVLPELPRPQSDLLNSLNLRVKTVKALDSSSPEI